ncbi:ATP-binding protein [Streptomyces sp. BYX5S]
MIGRSRQLDEVRRLLSGRAGLTTVVGPPGAGTSTVAALAASRRGRGGWAEHRRLALGRVRDPALLPHAVGTALRLPDDFTRGRLDTLLDALAGRSLLLVLDDCDHLSDGVPAFVGPVLARCPGVGFLVSARRPLHVPGERLVAVPPLAPEAARTLFTVVVRQSARRFWPTGRDLALIAEVCERLDRLPLAVELAARSLSAMSLAQLAELTRTPHCLSLGAGLPRPAGSPDRHGTLGSAIGWSHELCSPRERLLWARLSAVEGAFGPAEAVAACADEHLTPTAVTEGTTRLLDHSLLVRARPDPVACPRWRMPRTIRIHGAMMLRLLGETG